MKRYEKIGEAYLFWIKGLVESLPKGQKEDFKSTLIKKLDNYEFKKRSKNDPPHPNSIINIGEESFTPKSIRDPNDVFETITTMMHPYYLSPTQNRIKKYIINHL